MTWNGPETALPDIVRVDALDGDCFDVTLSNGHSMMLELGDRVGNPIFARLIENRLFDRPQTDGRRLYWQGGPSYSVAELFAMLAEETKANDLKEETT